MVSTLDDTKRMAIGSKLADMKLLQNLLIENEQKLLSACADQEICARLREMLEADQRNLGILDTVIVQYGVKGEPKKTSQKMVDEVRKLMEGSELTLFEKASQHELLKHKQTMTGLLIHKAAQVVGADIEAAIAPLNTINFDNRAHQEQLKGILEILGTRELTGKDPDQGLWGRVQDAIAAFSGVVGSAVTKNADREDMTIGEIIRMDHSKARTLFMEIENSNDPQRTQEFFGQLYKDLMAHAKAEEQVVYPAVRPYYQDTQDLYNEQAEQARMLDEIKSMSPSSPGFKDKVRQLKDAINHHVNQEENSMLPKLRDNFSSEQQQQMATEFKSAKSKLQDQMAAKK